MALAPDQRAIIKNPAAHAHFINLYPLMMPDTLKLLKAKGVSQWRLKMLKDMVCYYRSRAYDGIERNHRMEQKRKHLLDVIMKDIQGATK